MSTPSSATHGDISTALIIPVDEPRSTDPIASSRGASEPSQHWKNGLFSCLSNIYPSCLASMFCRPCLTARFYDQYVKRGSYTLVLLTLIILAVFYQTSDRLGMNQPSFPEPYLYTFMITSLISGLALAGLATYWLTTARGALRSKYHIKGSTMIDCLASFFCACCTVSQMYRQVHPMSGCCEKGDIKRLGPVYLQEDEDEDVVVVNEVMQRV